MSHAPESEELRRGLRGLERRLDRLQAEAEQTAAEHERQRERRDEAREFLAQAPQAQALLEDLTRALFGEVLDDVETNLTHAIREILGQERKVVSTRDIHGSQLSVEFHLEQDGKAENILHGSGGSVCNLLSTGLRLIALSQLDPARHRPFLVLDEQDCWLRPDLVPRFMGLIAEIAQRLSLQVLVISHHPVDLFAEHADVVYGLRGSNIHGVRVEVLGERQGALE